MFSIVLAKAIGGKHEYRFDNASDMYNWLILNRPDMFPKEKEKKSGTNKAS